MIGDPFPGISDEHRDAVSEALGAAFGAVRVDAIALVEGGASGAFPYKVQVGQRRVLVRIEGPASPLRNPHQYEALRIASAAGIAPPVFHVDEGRRVAVMAYIDERPLGTFPGGALGLATAIGAMLARVRDAPVFPYFVDYPAIVGRLWRWVCQTRLFAAGVLGPYTERFEHLCQRYARNAVDPVSSHNDPVPRNILFDGRRLWLIDWESAYRNDPLVDLAITLDNFAPTNELERALLISYDGDALDTSFVERLATVRALTRLYYAGVLLSGAARDFGALADSNTSAPSVETFQRMIDQGRVRAGSSEARYTLGKMYLDAFVTGARPPGFGAAIRS